MSYLPPIVRMVYVNIEIKQVFWLAPIKYRLPIIHKVEQKWHNDIYLNRHTAANNCSEFTSDSL